MASVPLKFNQFEKVGEAITVFNVTFGSLQAVPPDVNLGLSAAFDLMGLLFPQILFLLL